MPLLLDSHVFLWAVTSDDKLPKRISDLIKKEPLVYISMASLWELTLKAAIGRLIFPATLIDQLENYRCKPLTITVEHIKQYALLPNIHGDPFDRMMIAQAKHEQLTLVTADNEIQKYDVKCLVAK